ncbi:hypothetical protein A2318_02955 [Candidatus Uhrbacteria bacterium RIFOXYB2_FULL_45_11]|uniref:Uncharacterized protein n=1 Tax=Candidatus Uhrbacteria bacterium RIFOXYB2_FULL_45_11 TaxID=1802421 RepID=A0A1F7W4H9_9BACT|nr:MAG: hypothetical protein A2318_02955 [Candidatus Uhrbacteria bacterium RIFOXYB2_FULL_45_11]
MLTFGKSRTGRKGLTGTRRFDNLVGVGPRVANSNFDQAENDRFMRTLKVSGAPRKPGRGIEICWADRDENDFDEGPDLVFANPPCGGRYVDNKKRKIKQLEKEIKDMHIGTHSFWMLRQVREQKLGSLPEKLERYTMEEPLGQVHLESNPDGEEKIARFQARDTKNDENRHWLARVRTSHTWKNSGRVKRAGAQWGRHEETVHVPWSIVDEACATYLAWKREDEVWAQVLEQALSNLFLMDEAREADRYFEADLLDDLEWRYNYGYWCHSEDGPVWADDVDDDIDFTKDEEWAWQQAAA